MLAVAKRKPIKAEDDDENRTVAFRITEDDLWEAFCEYRAKFRVPQSKTDIMTVALQDFLRSEGHYPRHKKL